MKAKNSQLSTTESPRPAQVGIATPWGLTFDVDGAVMVNVATGEQKSAVWLKSTYLRDDQKVIQEFTLTPEQADELGQRLIAKAEIAQPTENLRPI